MAQQSLIIFDGSIHALRKKELLLKFADSEKFVVIELHANAPGLEQLAAIFKAHPNPAASYVYAERSSTSPEVKFGSTTYAGTLEYMSAVSPILNAAGGAKMMTGFNNIDDAFVPGGTASDDVFQSARQKEVFDGMEGLDTVRFLGLRSDYRLDLPQTQSSPWQLDSVGVYSSSQRAELFNVERVMFSDSAVALDLADGESANTAIRLLTAVAGKDSVQDKALLGEVLAYTDQFDLGSLARVLIDAGVMAQFAGGTSDRHLVQHLYANIAGEAPSEADLQWTLNYVADAGLTQAGILEAMVQLPHTAARADLVGLAQKGMEYQSYDLF